ncbi:MAG: N-acetyl-gamma-glutamyl-phosphate reductase [Phycisphaerae bacterium]
MRIGIIGVSGYGGGEALRLVAQHPDMELVHVAGESSAGSRLGDRFPALPDRYANLTIQPFEPEKTMGLDLVFASLPTGASQEPLARVPASVKIVDIGGDHRYVDGWTYGLADAFPDEVRQASRVANPGCYPAATLSAVVPLLQAGLVTGGPVIVDAKSGVSGAGRGGGNTFGFAEVNESVAAYKLLNHSHMAEIEVTMARFGTPGRAAGPLTFVPHLIPMTRGILATCYLSGEADAAACAEAARAFYAGRAFVRVTDSPPASKLATGSNMAFVHYAADPKRKLIIAVGAIDNLGKGAAGQAVQNANLMLGLDETAGLTGMPLWP